MLSNIYLQNDSPILLALFVKYPDLEMVQTIYGRESLTRGALRELTTRISLRSFLENQPLLPSGKWYQVVKKMKKPGKKDKHPIRFSVPRDQDLKIGILNHLLVPIQDQTGVMQCKVFKQLNLMHSYQFTQTKLNDIFQKGQSDLALSISSSDSDLSSSSSSDSDEPLIAIDKLPSISSSSFASSRRYERHKTSHRSLPIPTAFSSSSLMKPGVSSLTPAEPSINISEIQPPLIQSDEMKRCNQIFVEKPDVHIPQSVYVMSEGKLQEITVVSLQYLLQEQPRTRSGDAIEFGTFINDSLIHFHLSLNNLTISMLDKKSMPIKDKYGRIIALGIMNKSNAVSGSDLEKIQQTLENWPHQYRPRTLSSASDPMASFRTVPPAHKMRPVRTTSGLMSLTSIEPKIQEDSKPSS